MKVSVEMVGGDKLLALLERAYSNGTVREVGSAMHATANTVLNESKKIVPVDTGTLKSSGRVTGPEYGDKSVEVEISYGGPASAYARRQHYDLTLRHKSGQQALYLQKPVLEYRDKFVREVFARYMAAVKRG